MIGKNKKIFIGDRLSFLLDLVKNKSILNIGACDSPFHAEKLKSGFLLHDRLNNVTKNCIGIDIDDNAIRYLKNKNLNNIINLSFNKCHEEFNNKGYSIDYIVFGETIEHLLNFDEFFLNIKKIMDFHNAKLIITTPNVFFIKSIINHIRGNIRYHPDHTVLFSREILISLINRYDLHIDFFGTCFMERQSFSVIDKILIKISKLFPHLGETLLFVCSPKK